MAGSASHFDKAAEDWDDEPRRVALMKAIGEAILREAKPTYDMALHHIKDTEKVLRAFCDLLVPGGTLCLADLDMEPGNFHPAEMADIVHHHGFNRERLERQLADVGFSQMKDTTALTFNKPVEGQDPQKFSVFLITSKR